MPAKVDIATQDIVEMARGLDPGGERTLGVLTKPDLVEGRGGKGHCSHQRPRYANKARMGDCPKPRTERITRRYTSRCNRRRTSHKTPLKHCWPRKLWHHYVYFTAREPQWVSMQEPIDTCGRSFPSIDHLQGQAINPILVLFESV